MPNLPQLVAEVGDHAARHLIAGQVSFVNRMGRHTIGKPSRRAIIQKCFATGAATSSIIGCNRAPRRIYEKH